MLYKFGVKNWKGDGPAFWIRKRFDSPYAADRWAMRLTFSARNSPYMVWLIVSEIPAECF